ncbi:MAG: hypothetical protein LBN94_03200 [Puniceicoccales bacterium]|jgi:hypothetical protein|nr:hypothetical protein [Puniceicoccales bacterium]
MESFSMKNLSIGLITFILCFSHFLEGRPHRSHENWAYHREHGQPVKFSTDPDIPTAKVRPSTYSGRLERFRANFFQLFLPHPNYEYRIKDDKGKITAFLDTSNLATATPLVNLVGKIVTVNGSSSPHRHRGTIIIKAKYIAPSLSQ